MAVDRESGSLAAPTTRDELFSPITASRISQEIVDQIRVLIRTGQLVPGERLPSERALCARFGVSRVTVREALRVLEASGLIEVRVGALGGAYVTSPTSEQVVLGITDLVATSVMSATEVTEARQLIELGMIPLICRNASAEDVADLLGVCDRAEQALARDSYTMELSAEFHIRLAEASHNRVLHMLVRSLQQPMLMSMQRAQEGSPIMGATGVHEHRELVEAIRDNRADLALEVMRRHLDRTAKRLAAEESAPAG